MSETQIYSTPIRRGVVQRLQYGDQRVSEMSDNLPTVKGNVHYHLQQLEEKGTVIQIDKEYWLKKEAYKKQRRLEKRFKKFRNKLKKQLSYNPNLGRFWKRYREFKRQREKFASMGFEVPDFTPKQIAESKKQTVKRVIKRKGKRKHRKFEQIREMKKICDWIERVFGINLPKNLKIIHHGNPMFQKKLKAAFG